MNGFRLPNSALTSLARRAAPLAALVALLCLAGPTSAAVTIGSLPPTAPPGGFSCSLCTDVQAADSGPNAYTALVGGVITSFSMRSGSVLNAADRFRMLMLEPASATQWRLTGTSASVGWADASAAALPDKTVTWKVRVPVTAGSHLGVDFRTNFGGNTAQYYSTASPLDIVKPQTGPSANLGDTSTDFATDPNYRINLSASIEPDADHDGYGDETQDGCPSDRADQGPCTKPVISGFKFSLNKFAVNKKGTVLSAATAKGTTIILTLSKAAHVTFTMNQKGVGRKVGKSCVKPTKKNAKRKKCTYYPHQYHFQRDLPAGTSNLGFSGRIKVGSKTRALPAGKYVATAYPFSIQSQLGGETPKTTFTVVPGIKKR